MLTMDKNKLGMLLFLGSEVSFFSVLILAYIYYYREYAEGPGPGTVLDPLLAGFFTIFLLASSFTFWRAQKSIEHGRHGALRAWLLVTIVLGAIFLAGQIWEYATLIGENVTIDQSLFATTFFTLTGFHGLHVLTGLIMIGVLLGLAQAGDFRGPHSTAIAVVEYYWHFVDVVWIIIFGIVYLWPLIA